MKQTFNIGVVIKETVTVEAETYEKAVELVKAVWTHEHDIQLTNHEIDPIEPKDLKEILDLLEQNGFEEASNLLQLHYNRAEYSE